ncbi:MAG: group II intron reverse transcriptase/maturase [Cecembia sp.]
MDVHVKKTVPVEYYEVAKAYRKVRQGGKAVGIDEESWTDFEKDVERNLYVIWNRMASGSYHPQAVREVEIPKKDGTMRKLGIPTLRDRIAQQVVKDYMEKRIDKLFHEHSYGYRPMKSAHQALEQVRQNNFRYDWVLDMDISKFFDEVDHELILKAVSHVMEEKWVLMYVERWLKMPVQKKDGTIEQKQGRGTPQGGVISPILANLYLHFAMDKWLAKHYPQIRFVRYADDAVIHCRSLTEAEQVKSALIARLAEVKLRVNESKTHIAYCKDYVRKGNHETVKFDFLGFSYQPRTRRSKYDGKSYLAFTVELSSSNRKKIIQTIREHGAWRDTRLDIEQIASGLNSKLRGWINYYGVYSKRNLRSTLRKIEYRLLKWLCKKHKVNVRKAMVKLKAIKRESPNLFYHWQAGYG